MIEMLRIYSKGLLENITIDELPPNPPLIALNNALNDLFTKIIRSPKERPRTVMLDHH